MSLIITFQGNIYNTNGIEFDSNEVKYQAYYHSNLNPLKNKWSQIRISNSGQYSIDLGDGDFLTQEGKIDIGDKVILCFWTPNSSNRLSTNLIEWSSILITLDSRETYIQDVQIKPASHPNNYFSLADGDYRINKILTLTDEGTNNNHSWSFAQCMQYQYHELFDVEIFKMNQLMPNCLNIYWHNDTEYAKSLGSSYNHIYPNIGDYTIIAEVFNVSGLTSVSEFPIKVRFNVPIVDFLLDNEFPFPLANLGLGQIVNINNNSHSVDNEINNQNWLFDWSVIDNGEYGISTEFFYSKLLDFKPSHQWINPGIFPITLTLNWFDGFDTNQISITKYVNQQVWDIGNGLTWDTPVMEGIEEIYIPIITGSSGTAPTVDYKIDDIIQFVDLSPTNEFNWEFDISGIHHIEQIIHYNDGFEDRLKTEIFTVNMQTIANYKYEKYGCGFKYISTSIAGTPPILDYLWNVIIDNTIIFTGTNNNTFYYAWPYSGNFTIELKVIDSVGNFDIKTEDFVHSECMTANVPVSGGGGVVYREIEKPDPIIRVNLRYKEDHEIINIDSVIKVELDTDGGI